MKRSKKIKGKAIALRCICDDGYYLITKGKLYLGIPSSHHSTFNIYIPNTISNSSFTNSKHTIPYPKSYFTPVNPSHKHDPRYY